MSSRKNILYVAVLLSCSCAYDPYVKDYDFSGVYITYQYDLRSLVVGEGMTFDFGAVLGGVIKNDRDREVLYAVDDGLLSADLSPLGGTYAFDGLVNNPSQNYVANAINSAGIFKMTPFPAEYYHLDNDGSMVIRKGSHTAVTTFSVDSLAVINDANMGYKPYYAFAWRIISADADSVITNKSFGVIALRLENMFFGDWYHGGRSVKVDASGKEIPGTESIYPTVMPTSGGGPEVYSLTTSGAYSCTTNFMHNVSGTMTVSMDGKEVSVSGTGITDMGSGWNSARLLQDRKVFLNYKYQNTDGTYTVVNDTLSFRNRVRDGVNEWQDLNPSHYGK